MQNYSIKKVKSQNQWRAFSWLLVYIGIFAVGLMRVNIEYSGVCDRTSIGKYMNGFYIIWGVTVAVSLFWWYGLTRNSGGLRKYLEENSFISGLLAIIAVWVVSIVLFNWGCQGIKDINGILQSAKYIFSVPCIFILNMYVFPPINIQEVILPTTISIRKFFVMGIFLAIIIANIWIFS